MEVQKNGQDGVEPRKSPQSGIWLCILFPPAASWRAGWIPFLLTTVLYLYGWLPAIPAALYYNFPETA